MPCSLKNIYEFCFRMWKLSASERQHIVFCSNNLQLGRDAFLIGCWLMTRFRIHWTNIYDLFEPIHDLLSCVVGYQNVDVLSCWSAVQSAAKHHHINFFENFQGQFTGDDALIEEFLHYARQYISNNLL
mmetsp:Transcript_74971/g.201177  ORF Transcript_74971/g.201177 Transcript_74971/m.201177 type:complete len:129 (+) Transcript_74971:146-532(+)